MNLLGMFSVDVRAAVKIPDLQKGRVIAYLLPTGQECIRHFLLLLSVRI